MGETCFVTISYNTVGRKLVLERTKRSGRELKQEWVQVYTVENGLIVGMEEFAATVYVSKG